MVARTRDLAVGYDGTAAVTRVNIEFLRGQRIALLGPNGGGKTTLFRALLGELRPQAGSIDVLERCASVPQTERSRLDYPVTALDVAAMGALGRTPWWRRPGRSERGVALAALGEVGLTDRAERSFGQLSGGQRQRVLVARALVQDAHLLLLDEPFVGLDTTSSERLERILGRLAADGRAVVVATHDLDQARRYDRVLCLNGSQIAWGPAEETLDRDTLQRTYGGQLVELPAAAGSERSPVIQAHRHPGP